ncbi:pirin family protein [Pseudomonas veronii]|uniref:pirin family protein n=1 Tax=Pseudomonas veronii TaxID=76761 RepID=UPI002D78D2B7|nr:pirin family protein [Pseudomonas veronii]WRU61156.1 pirin family protein [Pseudomonas veronii]
MFKIHHSNDRGTFTNSWLKAKFSFEFGGYRNKERKPYSDLLVFNDDIVAPGGGFSPHPHDNVEVISFPLAGKIQHTDSLGSHAIISYGDVHLMRAGSGIFHSEMNASALEAEHHVQWWITPKHQNSKPTYQVKNFTVEEKLNRLCLIASQDGEAGSLMVDQDIKIYASIIDNHPIPWSPPHSRRAYVHILSGTLAINDIELEAGDGVHIENEHKLLFHPRNRAEFILFDLR